MFVEGLTLDAGELLEQDFDLIGGVFVLFPLTFLLQLAEGGLSLGGEIGVMLGAFSL